EAGPARLAGRGPQVGQLAALERAAGRLDGVRTRQRAAGGLAQELLLVAQCEVHTAASFSLARSSEKGMPLSSRGSGGRPSTRSPTVLRRISSVPPADFRPGRNEIAYAHSEASSSSASGPITSAMRSVAAIAALTVVTLASAASGPGI